MPAKTTRATDTLDRAGVTYTIHEYTVAEKVGDGYGEAVAAAIGLPAGRVFKTLMAEVDGVPVVAVVPVDRPALDAHAGAGSRREAGRDDVPGRCGAGHWICDGRDQPVRPEAGPGPVSRLLSAWPPHDCRVRRGARAPTGGRTR